MNTRPCDMSEAQFVDVFGGVYEHSPWIAKTAWQNGLDEGADSAEGLSDALARVFMSSTKEQQLQVILAHPDLAGKAAVRGELTVESTSEQAGAGIDQCSAEELSQFQKFNNRYKKQFDFPFIMAVKGSNRYKILEAFEVRLKNDADCEFETALQEINKIARFRLQAIFDE